MLRIIKNFFKKIDVSPSSFNSFQLRARSLVASLFILVAILSLFLIAVRWCQQIVFINGTIPQHMIQSDDLQRMWIMGIRFDWRAIAICLLPAFLIGLICSLKWIPQKLWSGVTTCCVVGASLLIALLAIGNFYYIQTFRNHFEIFVFSFLHESPVAVMTTVWQDYPIVTVILACVIFASACGWVWLKCLNYFVKRLKKWHWIFFTVFLLCAIVLFYALVRGSITTRYPLRRNNAQISVIEMLNKTVPNGPIALAWAATDFRRDRDLSPAPKNDQEELLKKVGLNSLYEKTPKNSWLEKNKPNVVVCLMESMGQNMLTYDNLPETDLLGSLRKYFVSDFVFHRFISEDIHTIQSFSAIFFISPVSNISTSISRNVKLPETPFEKYKKAGYKTIYVTPGTKTWERMGSYLKIQGVDEVYDQSDLMDRFGIKEVSEWGLPDEYAFKFANELLEKKGDQPVFIVILTTTNHPPFAVPKGYSPLPVKPTQALKERGDFGAQNEIIVMQTYQYATNALGNFIDRVVASKEGDKTIIAATGDHKMQRMQGFLPREQFNEYAVPFYLRLPKPIKANVALKFDPKRVGSHKDIMPTLYNYSLSDTKYLAVGGRNIMAPIDDSTRAFGYNIELWADDKCVYSMRTQPTCFAWDPENHFMTLDTHKATDEKQKEKMSSYPKLLNWQLRARVKGVN